MSTEREMFEKQFDFRQGLVGHVGIERERFLSLNGSLVPRSTDFLDHTNHRWTYELSACQVEDRTLPQRSLKEVRRELQHNDQEGQQIALGLGLQLCAQEAGQEDMPLDVYPDPRYSEIVRGMARHTLRAACRVTGTHIHIGVGNIEEAVRIHNVLQPHIDEFCTLGDHSQGERLRLYRMVAPNHNPPQYRNATHLFEVARQQRFTDNPRNCWHLLRISLHGTVELRMFGVTESHNEILFWVESVLERAGL